MVVQNSINSKPLIKSSYLQYLPALYRDDKFVEQFILIFESILRPLENTVNNLDLYLDPKITPEPFLPWLAFWLDLSLDPTWPINRRRELVKSGAELYRWAGTKRGLSEYLRIYTGNVPEIYEFIPGMQLGHDTQLGIDTKLGSSGTGYHFTINLDLDEDSTINTDTVRAIVESQKPAHSVYTLHIRRNGQGRHNGIDA